MSETKIDILRKHVGAIEEILNSPTCGSPSNARNIVASSQSENTQDVLEMKKEVNDAKIKVLVSETIINNYVSVCNSLIAKNVELIKLVSGKKLFKP